MEWRSYRIHVLLLCTALLLPPKVTAQGTFVYDQQSVANDTAGGEGSPAIQSNQPLGQSFTPALNAIDFVRLVVFDANQNNGLGATLLVNLRSDSITGPILASTTPISLPDSFGRGSNGIVNFIFPSRPSLTPGNIYYLQPVVQSGDLWQIADDINFAYPGGAAFFSGLPASNFDLWFREGIIIPEPSQTQLVVVALLVCTLALRKSPHKIGMLLRAISMVPRPRVGVNPPPVHP